MLISLLVAAALVAFMERVPRLRFRPLPFFRRFFATDVFYLLTGFVAGGSIAVAYPYNNLQNCSAKWTLPSLQCLPFLPVLQLLMGQWGDNSAHRYRDLFIISKRRCR